MFKLNKKVIASALAVMSLAGPVGAFNITQAEAAQLNDWIGRNHAPTNKFNFRANWRQEVQNVLLNRANRVVNTKHLATIIEAINNNCMDSCNRFTRENFGFNYSEMIDIYDWEQFNIAECRAHLNDILIYLQLNNNLDFIDIITCMEAGDGLLFKIIYLLNPVDTRSVGRVYITSHKQIKEIKKCFRARRHQLRNNAGVRGLKGQDVVVDAEGLRQTAIELLRFNLNEIDNRLRHQH